MSLACFVDQQHADSAADDFSTACSKQCRVIKLFNDWSVAQLYLKCIIITFGLQKKTSTTQSSAIDVTRREDTWRDARSSVTCPHGWLYACVRACVRVRDAWCMCVVCECHLKGVGMGGSRSSVSAVSSSSHRASRPLPYHHPGKYQRCTHRRLA